MSQRNQNVELYEFGPFRVDAVERVLAKGQQVIPLTPKAFDTLVVLVRNSGHVVEKDALLKEVWPDTFVEEGDFVEAGQELGLLVRPVVGVPGTVRHQSGHHSPR